MANSTSSKSKRRPAERLAVRPPNSLADDWRALWLVRSRIIRGNLAFILVIMGYDPRSRSINNRIYLVYAIAFFALWFFMVLTLLADFGARMLAALPFGDPATSAVLLGSLALAVLLIFDLYQAARRSPLSLNEIDAQVIGMTPIDRRLVTLQWLFETWLSRLALVGSGAIVLGYALLQAASPRDLTAADLPAYLLAGGRMFVVAAPLYLGTLSLAWAVGAWRLRGQIERANLRWVAPLLAGLLVAALWVTGWSGALLWLAPLVFPVRSGLNLVIFWPGLLLALALAALGLLAVWQAARGMSLSRAAQETQDREAIQAAALLGQADVVEELAGKERLGAGREPTRLPGRPGLGALLWKNLVQARRRFTLGTAFGWLSVFALLLVLLFFPGWTTRVWSLAFGAMLVMRLMLAPLRRELSRWWLMRQLPFTSNHLVASALALPLLGMLLAGLLALGVGGWLGAPLPPVAIWVYLVTVPALGLSAAYDVLRQSKTGRLLTGSVPDLSMVGLLLGLTALAMNAGAAWFALVRWELPFVTALPMIVTVGVMVLYFLWEAAGHQLRQMQ